MKKVLAILLALALMIPAMSIAAFAGKLEDLGAESQEINATYVPAEEVADVYSINIGWGSLAFTYTEPAQGTWNPDTLQYDGAVAGGWTFEDKANEITVENLSEVAVTATLSAVASVDTVVLSWKDDINVLNLDTAANGGENLVLEAAAYLVVSGTITAGGVIGSVTVTLTDTVISQ